MKRTAGETGSRPWLCRFAFVSSQHREQSLYVFQSRAGRADRDPHDVLVVQFRVTQHRLAARVDLVEGVFRSLVAGVGTLAPIAIQAAGRMGQVAPKISVE